MASKEKESAYPYKIGANFRTFGVTTVLAITAFGANCWIGYDFEDCVNEEQEHLHIKNVAQAGMMVWAATMLVFCNLFILIDPKDTSQYYWLGAVTLKSLMLLYFALSVYNLSSLSNEHLKDIHRGAACLTETTDEYLATEIRSAYAGCFMWALVLIMVRFLQERI